MLLPIIQAINDAGAVFGLVTFFLGYLLGHRLALGRERRIEFNAAAQPIRSYFLELIEKPWAAPFIESPSVDELHEFEARLNFWRRSAFRKSYAGVLEAAKNISRGEAGEVKAEGQDVTTARARKALKFVRVR